MTYVLSIEEHQKVTGHFQVEFIPFLPEGVISADMRKLALCKDCNMLFEAFRRINTNILYSHIITVVKEDEKLFCVYYRNDVKIGEFVINDDGYYVFFPNDDRSGYWNAELLVAVGQKLMEMNKEWHEQVKGCLSE